MKIKKYLGNMRKMIDEELDRHLAPKKSDVKDIYKAMRYAVLSGGKRIRPILLVEACRALGGNLKQALGAGCAVEFIHAYSLIHDDLPSMDNDDFRRGIPTCHKVFGEANAILAGDALLPMAFNIISATYRPSKALPVIKELSEAIGTRGMVGGQVLDLKYRDKRKTALVICRINQMKTARLFEASTKLGAIAAGATKKQISDMGRFGLLFGLSYQIIDDILDESDYVKVFGMDRSRRDAQGYIHKAIRSLAAFGKKADRLKKIAEYYLVRNS